MWRETLSILSRFARKSDQLDHSFFRRGYPVFFNGLRSPTLPGVGVRLFP